MGAEKIKMDLCPLLTLSRMTEAAARTENLKIEELTDEIWKIVIKENRAKVENIIGHVPRLRIPLGVKLEVETPIVVIEGEELWIGLSLETLGANGVAICTCGSCPHCPFRQEEVPCELPPMDYKILGKRRPPFEVEREGWEVISEVGESERGEGSEQESESETKEQAEEMTENSAEEESAEVTITQSEAPEGQMEETEKEEKTEKVQQKQKQNRKVEIKNSTEGEKLQITIKKKKNKLRCYFCRKPHKVNKCPALKERALSFLGQEKSKRKEKLE